MAHRDADWIPFLPWPWVPPTSAGGGGAGSPPRVVPGATKFQKGATYDRGP